MKGVKVRKVGNFIAVTLPTEIAQLLHVSEGGDEVFLPAFEQKPAAMKAVAGRDRDTLKTLSQ